jgi:hypothetical protein
MKTWRDHYRPVIAKVISEVGISDMKALRKALREAFPNPPRKFHPYKIWLDEIKVQLGTKKKKPSESKDETGMLF